MEPLSSNVFLNYLVFLLIPFLSGFVAKRLRMQPLIGYILGGVLLGNIFTGLLSNSTVNGLANFGIILLLFTIGLELNFERIIGLKKFIVWGGLLQIVLSSLFIALLCPLFGFNLLQSFLIGIALSSSSTTVVAKIIQERGEESSFIGELVMGILLFQDLAFIPFAILFTFISNQSGSFFTVAKDITLGTVESAIILGVMYYVGKRIVPMAFDRVAKSSRELLNLFIIVFIMSVCYLSSLVGVPIFISVFVAGVLVSQTTEHYHIFTQLRPLRDLMAIIFFVFIGTHIPVLDLLPMIPQLLSFSLLVILIKLLVVIGIFYYFKFNSRVIFFIAVFLFQVDEDAFILLSLSYSHHLLSYQQFSMLITSVMLSLLLTPILVARKEVIFYQVRRFFKHYLPAVELYIHHHLDTDPTPIDVMHLKNHIIICGYGRVGAHVGRALIAANIPFIAIDYNFHTVQKARKEGINIIYGDSTDRQMLDYAEVENAAGLISVVPDRFSQEAIILNAKKLNPRIVVISRVHKHHHHQRLKDLGANVVIEPELEASLSILKKIFYIKHVPEEEVVRNLRHFKLEQGMV